MSKAHAWELDPMNVAFIGDSAGAYLSTMVALKSGISSYKIKLLISLYGVFDIVEWEQYTNKTRSDFVVNKLFGTDSSSGYDVYRDGNPLVQIEKVARNPIFGTEYMLINGEEDTVVLPENQTLAFSYKLSELKIPFTMHKISDRGHFWFTKNGNIAMNQDDGDLYKYPISEVRPVILEKLNATLSKNSEEQ
ncbi:MAG: prolyl oligopeptidase family serine peptidase [Anaerotignum sp.]|nr:prolyl oligopeptidase family serine peptidase [Anaerotignum sp.]